MESRKTSVTKVLPILFSFFVIGFCDVVGIATTYVKSDFDLNEGLLKTGVDGGAIIPPLMGLLTEQVGSQAGSLLVLSACALYLIFCAFNIKANK